MVVEEGSVGDDGIVYCGGPTAVRRHTLTTSTAHGGTRRPLVGFWLLRLTAYSGPVREG